MTTDPELSERLPPSDQLAESMILSSMMRDNGLFGDVSQILQPEDFYSFAHRLIYLAITSLVAEGKPADPKTVFDVLEVRNQGDDIGGPGYLANIWDNAWTSQSTVVLAEGVRKKAILRSVIRAANEMQSDAFDAAADPQSVVSRAESLIFDLARRDGAKTVTWSQALAESSTVIDRRSGKSQDGETEEGMKTGWPKLDKITGGLHRRELVILAARPSVGKTLAALNMIDRIASDGGRVFFASIEQGRVELVHRILSKRGGINSHKFRTGGFNDWDKQQLGKAIDSVRGHRVWINDGSGQSLAQIMSESRRIKMRDGLDMVAVDYLGLMDVESNRRSTRNEEIGRLTRGLKRLAKDLDVTVLCLAQLNRGSENRPDKKPRLSDLRDSGEIEQDADTVFMLHKSEEKDAQRETDLLDWLIEKQRNGPCGEVAMVHHKKTFEICELATGGMS